MSRCTCILWLTASVYGFKVFPQSLFLLQSHENNLRCQLRCVGDVQQMIICIPIPCSVTCEHSPFQEGHFTATVRQVSAVIEITYEKVSV